LRRLLAALRDRLDGLLHPYRRARARRRLSTIEPVSVLFVCLGNICRSPYAERVLLREGGEAIRSFSAGIMAPGRRPPQEALEAARRRGIDHADHVSRALTRDLLDDAGALFVFDRHNARSLPSRVSRAGRVFWLGDFDPQWAGRRAILDPWGKPLEEFERTFERIERCVAEVTRTLGTAATRQ
jgi:protein-tyrosine phosphatase